MDRKRGRGSKKVAKQHTRRLSSLFANAQQRRWTSKASIYTRFLYRMLIKVRCYALMRNSPAQRCQINHSPHPPKCVLPAKQRQFTRQQDTGINLCKVKWRLEDKKWEKRERKMEGDQTGDKLGSIEISSGMEARRCRQEVRKMAKKKIEKVSLSV